MSRRKRTECSESDSAAGNGSNSAAGPVLVEPNGSGHRLSYVRLLVQACRERGLEPKVILSNDAMGTPEYKTHLGDLDLRDLQLIPSAGSSRSVRRRYVLAALKAAQKCDRK